MTGFTVPILVSDIKHLESHAARCRLVALHRIKRMHLKQATKLRHQTIVLLQKGSLQEHAIQPCALWQHLERFSLEFVACHMQKHQHYPI